MYVFGGVRFAYRLSNAYVCVCMRVHCILDFAHNLVARTNINKQDRQFDNTLVTTRRLTRNHKQNKPYVTDMHGVSLRLQWRDLC